MKEIQLWRTVPHCWRGAPKYSPIEGRFALVGDGHYDYLMLLCSHWLWNHTSKGQGYAYRCEKGSNKVIFMARDVADLMGWAQGSVDHKEPSETLNNQPDNLRPADWSQQACNQRLRSNNSLREKNITWLQRCKRYRVKVNKNNRLVYDKCFPTLDEARTAAEAARRKYHGEFARRQ